VREKHLRGRFDVAVIVVDAVADDGDGDGDGEGNPFPFAPVAPTASAIARQGTSLAIQYDCELKWKRQLLAHVERDGEEEASSS